MRLMQAGAVFVLDVNGVRVTGEKPLPADMLADLAANEAEMMRLLRGDDPRGLSDEHSDYCWIRVAG